MAGSQIDSLSGSTRRLSYILQQAVRELEDAGVSGAGRDAALLLGACLGKTPSQLYLAGRDVLDGHQQQQFFALIARRKAREPVAYILGEREFWSLAFAVSPAVLIPRPETEFLLETVLARRNAAFARPRCLDLCCGSGVIAVVLARELSQPVIAVDISAAALAVARQNCLRHQVGDRVSLLQADLLSCFSPRRQFELIVSNPPYVRRSELDEELEPEVAGYEPHLALDGGDSGLELIARISSQAPGLLAPGGDLFLEIGESQGQAVRRLFLDQVGGRCFHSAEIYPDYAGRDRVVHLRRV